MTDKSKGAKATEKGAVELNESALDEASGGAGTANLFLKLGGSDPGAAKIAPKVWGDPHIKQG